MVLAKFHLSTLLKFSLWPVLHQLHFWVLPASVYSQASKNTVGIWNYVYKTQCEKANSFCHSSKPTKSLMCDLSCLYLAKCSHAVINCNCLVSNLQQKDHWSFLWESFWGKPVFQTHFTTLVIFWGPTAAWRIQKQPKSCSSLDYKIKLMWRENIYQCHWLVFSIGEEIIEVWEGQGASCLSLSKPRKSEIDIYVPSLILKVVGREGEREVYSVVWG